jgi:hypothetical protein
MEHGEVLSASASLDALRAAGRGHANRPRVHPAGVSRRQFIQGAAGVTACGALIGSAIFDAEAEAAGPGIGLVVPIPTTLTAFGEEIHVQAPPFTGEDSDPSTVYDFRGSAGIAFISGACQRTDRKTGASRTLPFVSNDMRFMQGRFQGRDGHVRRGTFVFT